LPLLLALKKPVAAAPILANSQNSKTVTATTPRHSAEIVVDDYTIVGLGKATPIVKIKLPLPESGKGGGLD